MAREFVEYEFTLPDGSKRYEIVDLTGDNRLMPQLWAFKKLHGATGFRPVKED